MRAAGVRVVRRGGPRPQTTDSGTGRSAVGRSAVRAQFRMRLHRAESLRFQNAATREIESRDAG